ncbi:hypothetical protein nbrc107696_06070 [Gordonia spumicola]|uniref:Uncharacterized protein n=1 Tax=Gordonia spumicola TaxID=589161 RepID=A0A7I9V570_9ACTN|nr:hypothetical protein [Gordonia spumicola]GEE00161.1 hypothetical protein nbrc107696_06070 [Gordonia spumicola]
MTSGHGTLGWLADFPIPPAPTGAVLAITFGDDGVWMGRVDGTRRVIGELREARIVPAVLDVRIAGELVENGKVPEAEDPEVFAELIPLAAHTRTTIGDRDSALAMGRGAVSFVSVTRVDMVEATVPEVNRLHGMLIELAGSQPVDAILLGPGTDGWPGLWEAFTERGFSALLPGDPFPATFGGDDRETGLLDRVDETPATLAWTEQSDESGPMSFTASGIDPADYELDDNGDVQYETAPVDGPSDEERELQARRRRRWTAAAAVVVLLGLAGAGTAVAMNVHEHGGPTMAALDSESASDTAQKPSTTSSEPERIPTTADPTEMAAARSTMLAYTTPPPPPPPKKTTKKPSTGRTPDPGHKRRTVPNPIPGLPPIVVN